mgnify:CR=1 FL=1
MQKSYMKILARAVGRRKKAMGSQIQIKVGSVFNTEPINSRFTFIPGVGLKDNKTNFPTGSGLKNGVKFRLTCECFPSRMNLEKCQPETFFQMGKRILNYLLWVIIVVCLFIKGNKGFLRIIPFRPKEPYLYCYHISREKTILKLKSSSSPKKNISLEKIIIDFQKKHIFLENISILLFIMNSIQFIELTNQYYHTKIQENIQNVLIGNPVVKINPPNNSGVEIFEMDLGMGNSNDFVLEPKNQIELFPISKMQSSEGSNSDSRGISTEAASTSSEAASTSSVAASTSSVAAPAPSAAEAAEAAAAASRAKLKLILPCKRTLYTDYALQRPQLTTEQLVESAANENVIGLTSMSGFMDIQTLRTEAHSRSRSRYRSNPIPFNGQPAPPPLFWYDEYDRLLAFYRENNRLD